MRSQESALFLGLDLGTSSLKALALDGRGRVAGRASRAYPLERRQPDWAEQNPADWWAAAVGAMDDLTRLGMPVERVAAIGLSGQMHGLVALDGHGEPLGACQTWADARCVAEARGIERRISPARLLAITGSRANPSATAAKLLWLRRHEPEHWRATQHVLLPKDYLRWRLTGNFATDASDASGTLLCGIERRDWSDELLGALAIPREWLPPVCECTAMTGALTAEAAQALGLRPGIPVVAGGGDAECAALGMGLVGATEDEGVALASLGTAGQFFAVTPRPVVDAAGRIQTLCHAAPDRWHIMRAILSGAATLDWLARAVATPGAAAISMETLLAEAEYAPQGANGLLFLPHLSGMRVPTVDPAIGGAFVGLRAEHGRGALARAVVEGVALALREGLTAARELGVGVERVRLAGGAARHPFWARVLADVFGLPVEMGATEDASALGAAMLAGVGVGEFTSLGTAASVVCHAGAVTRPDTAASEMYARLGEIAWQAQTRLQGTFHALAKLRDPR